MNKRFFLLSMLVTSLNSFSQSVNVWDYIENEQVISENKEAAHATFTSFSSSKNLKENTPRFKQLLDGLWKFKWVKSPKDKHTTFMDPLEDVSNWDDIKVPSNWEVEGFGISLFIFKAMIKPKTMVEILYFVRDLAPQFYLRDGNYTSTMKIRG